MQKEIKKAPATQKKISREINECESKKINEWKK